MLAAEIIELIELVLRLLAQIDRLSRERPELAEELRDVVTPFDRARIEALRRTAHG